MTTWLRRIVPAGYAEATLTLVGTSPLLMHSCDVGFYNKRAGRVIITDDSARSRPWKAQVADAAAQAMNGGELLRGALVLKVDFVLPRPKGHFGTGRNAGVLRASAPRYPCVKPDATKLLRAIEDACTGIVWKDDAQVVSQHVWKLYGEPARAEIRVYAVENHVEDYPSLDHQQPLSAAYAARKEHKWQSQPNQSQPAGRKGRRPSTSSSRSAPSRQRPRHQRPHRQKATTGSKPRGKQLPQPMLRSAPTP